MRIIQHFFVYLILAVFSMTAQAETSKSDKKPRVIFETSMGNFTIELYPKEAPKTVENFLQYVDSGFYNGTIFHRVIPNFVVQGGGMVKGMRLKKTQPNIKNEADNGLKNTLGTLSMARTNDPHSASSQFFINLADNAFLDHRGKTPKNWGYAVFGAVIEGMDIINDMQKVKTTIKGGHRDVPAKAIIVKKAYKKP